MPLPDNYVEPWRRQATSLGGTEPAPNNGHLTQLQPRADKRSPALDRAVAKAREEEGKRLVSGHSLIRSGNKARWIN